MRGSRLTARGLGFCAAGLATVALAVVAGQPDLVWPGLFLLFLPLLSLLATVTAHPRLTVERTLVPPVVAVDAPTRVELRATAVGRLGTGQVLATDEPPRPVGAAHRFGIPAARRGQSVRESYTRRPRRRGRWALDGLRYEFTDILGLTRHAARAPSRAVLVVTPPVLPVLGGPGAAFGRQGETPIPQTAIAGPDDVLVREYQPLDDVRRIHWPSTARTGTLMVRREEQAWDPTAWLVLDSRAVVHPLRGDVAPSFEWLLTVAASLGTALLAEGYEVSIADASGGTFGVSSATRDPGSPARLLEHLVDAGLAEEGSLLLAARQVAQAPSGHLVVALLGRLDAETARHLVGTHDTQQRCRALVLPQPGAEHAARAGRAILVDHGWAVAECPVGADLGATWAGLATAGALR